LQARQAEIDRGVQADPLVQSVLARFPGAEIVAVHPRAVEDIELAAIAEAEDAAPEPSSEEDAPAFGARARPDETENPA
jgi:DNA polymerase III subunit gamma/tau